MRSITSVKIVLLTIITLSAACVFVAGAGAATPAQFMPAHLWIDGLPQDELIVVTVANHSTLNYFGGQGRYDFEIYGQPGELIQILVDGTEIQSFAYEPGAPAYISLANFGGYVTASTYHPGDPIPTTRINPTIPPGPTSERTGFNLDSSWVIVLAIMMALVVVGCVATVRRKTK